MPPIAISVALFSYNMEKLMKNYGRSGRFVAAQRGAFIQEGGARGQAPLEVARRALDGKPNRAPAILPLVASSGERNPRALQARAAEVTN